MGCTYLSQHHGDILAALKTVTEEATPEAGASQFRCREFLCETGIASCRSRWQTWSALRTPMITSRFTRQAKIGGQPAADDQTASQWPCRASDVNATGD
jgi:hypothetical protein